MKWMALSSQVRPQQGRLSLHCIYIDIIRNKAFEIQKAYKTRGQRKLGFQTRFRVFGLSWTSSTQASSGSSRNLLSENQDYKCSGVQFTHFWRCGQKYVEKVMFVTSLVQHVDLSNPFEEKRSWAIYFCAQFYPTPTLHSQVNRRWRSSGRKMQRCLIVPTTAISPS